MNPQPLLDLAPIARLALLGVVLAIGPLAWVWIRHRGADPATRLRVLTLLTLFLTFDLVLFGAFTRLTDSGLAAPTGRAATAARARSAHEWRFRRRIRPCPPDPSPPPRHGSR